MKLHQVKDNEEVGRVSRRLQTIEGLLKHKIQYLSLPEQVREYLLHYPKAQLRLQPLFVGVDVDDHGLVPLLAIS